MEGADVVVFAGRPGRPLPALAGPDALRVERVVRCRRRVLDQIPVDEDDVVARLDLDRLRLELEELDRDGVGFGERRPRQRESDCNHHRRDAAGETMHAALLWRHWMRETLMPFRTLLLILVLG